ncbi:hypothetical protein EPA93_46100 [Ktedonosporobacter rubrisoli]|uniref:PsbP C-terminal domain-containing protein n=1 Tax=Ktedonosporobacter rubrisoli TaxID=2509675 RepID=A0A4P6K3V0_KTERU|nr:hypothetical protein [Ktedonosporobacter rubrisoli]QBD82948.1 hypothetical protein EPA93_46100 [Ktedonosporobacter rubrisoli]
MKRILFLPLASSLFLMIALLSACGSGNVAAASPSAQTSAITTTQSMASTPTATLTSYQGNGFTIKYPGSWTVGSDGNNGSIFSAPDDSASLHVFVQDPNSPPNPLQIEFGTLAKDNCKMVGSGIQQVQVNGETWQQSQFDCMPADGGQAGGKEKQIGILISTNLHNNKSYSIDYIASSTNFKSAYQTFFKSMVASFKTH